MSRLRWSWLWVAFSGIALAQGPVVVDGGVINAASLAKNLPVTLGSFVAIFGSGFGSGGPTGTVPWPVSLGGTTVLMNGIQAPLYAVTDGQIDAQVPFEVLPAGQTSGSVIVIVQRNGQSSPVKSFQVTAFSPGIFSISGTGLGSANASNVDGSLVAPSGSIPGYAAHPAAPGDTIIILATGFGAVNSPIQTGYPSSDALRTTTTTPTVLVGGMQTRVTFSGLSPQFPAVNQLNVVLPLGVPAGSAVPLQVSLGGVTTTAQLTIAISSSTSSSTLTPLTTALTPQSQPRSLAVYGAFAYICGSNYVAVLDISNPAAPRLINTFGSNAFNNVGNLNCYVDSGTLVALADTGSTLAAGTGPSITTFSLANPAQPQLIKQTAINRTFLGAVFNRGYTAFATFNSLSFSGSTFLGQGGDFASFDVSDPSNPRMLSSLSGSSSTSGGPNNFFDAVPASDTIAYAASSTSTGNQSTMGLGRLVVADTSDPANVKQLREVQIPGTRQLLSITTQGNLAVGLGVVEGWRNPIDFSQGAIVGPIVVCTFDITDRANPVLLKSVVTSQLPALTGNGRAAIGAGRFVFGDVRNGTQDGLFLVDARDPQNPQSSIVFNTQSVIHDPVVVAPNLLYVLVDNLGLAVYQIGG